MRVGILYIATAKYIVFWKDFYESMEKLFMPECEKEYFVFTDADEIAGEDNPLVHKYFQNNLGWPDNTLKRFHIFLTREEDYKNCDYLFYMNANLVCMQEITSDEILGQLTEDKGVIVAKNPGFWNKTNKEFPYDRNPKCAAYIPEGEGEVYVAGGLNGGRREDYLEVVRELKAQTDKDIANKVIALWHDESQINKYVYTHDNYIVLDPSYLYPEDWDMPFTNKMMLREKSKWIPVDKIKQAKLHIRILKKCRLFLGGIKGRIYRLLKKV